MLLGRSACSRKARTRACYTQISVVFHANDVAKKELQEQVTRTFFAAEACLAGVGLLGAHVLQAQVDKSSD